VLKENSGKYVLVFTAVNVVFLVVLVLTYIVFEKIKF